MLRTQHLAAATAAGFLAAAPMAVAQDDVGPMVPEDRATHVAYLGAAESPTGTAYFQLNPQNNDLEWTITFDVADVTGASISCDEEADNRMGVQQFGDLNLVAPAFLESPIEGAIADVGDDMFSMISTGECSVSITTAANVHYSGVIEAVE